MTENAAHDRLLAKLAALHEAALTTSEQQLQSYRDTWQKRWYTASRYPRVPASPERRSKAQSAWRVLLGRRLILASVGAVLLLSAISVHYARRPGARVQIGPEPLTSRALARPVPAASTVAIPARSDPCAAHVRAAGTEPQIDDFEDGNPLIGAFENRVGLWNIFEDTDAPGSFHALTPALLPHPSRGNRYALHVMGAELLNWGAVIQFAFQPSCYDASVYSGVTFRAKGPGRVFVGMDEINVVPIEYGGTCTKDCYNRHQKKVDLTARWQTYTVNWNEMRQRGYDTPALDPSRVNGLSFLVQSGDTPYDFWVDDVRFVSR